MPWDGSGNYQYPPGTEGIPDTTIESIKYNTFIADLRDSDLNVPRPITRGGTGATTALAALQNLGGEKAQQVITNYDQAGSAWLSGSFYSDITATAPPVAGHRFLGLVTKQDDNNMVLEAFDLDSTPPGESYTRVKKAGVWQSGGAWGSGGFVRKSGDTMTGELKITTSQAWLNLQGSGVGGASAINFTYDAIGTWAIYGGYNEGAGADLNFGIWGGPGILGLPNFELSKTHGGAAFLSANGDFKILSASAGMWIDLKTAAGVGPWMGIEFTHGTDEAFSLSASSEPASTAIEWLGFDRIVSAVWSTPFLIRRSTGYIGIDDTVGTGLVNPRYQVHIRGVGQNVSQLDDAGAKGGSLFIHGVAVAGGSGGALLLGSDTATGPKPQAAIKTLLVDGANNGLAEFVISTRMNSPDTALTERFKIQNNGQITFSTNGVIFHNGASWSVAGNTTSFNNAEGSAYLYLWSAASGGGAQLRGPVVRFLTADGATNYAFFSSTGQDLFGDLALRKSSPVLTLNDTSGSATPASLISFTNSLNQARWSLYIGDGVTEGADGPTGTVGTNFRIRSHNNSGTNVTDPLVIERNGNATFSNLLFASGIAAGALGMSTGTGGLTANGTATFNSPVFANSNMEITSTGFTQLSMMVPASNAGLIDFSRKGTPSVLKWRLGLDADDKFILYDEPAGGGYAMRVAPGASGDIGFSKPLSVLGVNNPYISVTHNADPSLGVDTFSYQTSGNSGGGFGMIDGTANFGMYMASGTANFAFGTSLGALTAAVKMNVAGTGASSTSTGALIVTGGAGISENLHVGSNASIFGTLAVGTVNVGAGGVNGAGARKAAFFIHKNGVDQTGFTNLTWQQVNFSTETFDTGSYFSGSQWTPPAGPVMLSAAFVTNSVGGNFTNTTGMAIAIHKNGVAIAKSQGSSGGTIGCACISVTDVANGTDSYTCFANFNLTAGTGTVLGLYPNTWFCGHALV